jgi:hypothetical protein
MNFLVKWKWSAPSKQDAFPVAKPPPPVFQAGLSCLYQYRPQAARHARRRDPYYLYLLHYRCTNVSLLTLIWFFKTFKGGWISAQLSQNLGVQLTLFQRGGRLCQPYCCLPGFENLSTPLTLQQQCFNEKKYWQNHDLYCFFCLLCC